MSKGWLAGATPADRVTRAGSQGSRRDKPVLSCQRPPRRPTSPILRHPSRNPNVSIPETPPSSYLAGPFTVPSSPVSRSCLDSAPCKDALFSAHQACKNMSKSSRLRWIKPADACMLESWTLTGCRASARERIFKKASLYPKPVCLRQYTLAETFYIWNGYQESLKLRSTLRPAPPRWHKMVMRHQITNFELCIRNR